MMLQPTSMQANNFITDRTDSLHESSVPRLDPPKKWSRKMQGIKGPWSPEEDTRLTRLVNELGPEKWVLIASRLGSRTGKQCRERWHNHLDPTINKTPFTPEEDELIFRLYAQMGSKWAEMSKLMPGRPDNAIKNHFNTSLQRKKRKLSAPVGLTVNAVAANRMHAVAAAAAAAAAGMGSGVIPSGVVSGMVPSYPSSFESGRSMSIESNYDTSLITRGQNSNPNSISSPTTTMNPNPSLHIPLPTKMQRSMSMDSWSSQNIQQHPNAYGNNFSQTNTQAYPHPHSHSPSHVMRGGKYQDSRYQPYNTTPLLTPPPSATRMTIPSPFEAQQSIPMSMTNPVYQPSLYGGNFELVVTPPPTPDGPTPSAYLCRPMTTGSNSRYPPLLPPPQQGSVQGQNSNPNTYPYEIRRQSLPGMTALIQSMERINTTISTHSASSSSSSSPVQRPMSSMGCYTSLNPVKNSNHSISPSGPTSPEQIIKAKVEIRRHSASDLSSLDALAGLAEQESLRACTDASNHFDNDSESESQTSDVSISTSEMEVDELRYEKENKMSISSLVM